MIRKGSAKNGHKMLPLFKGNGVYNFYLKKGQHGSVRAIGSAELEPARGKSKKDILAELEGKTEEELIKIIELHRGVPYRQP